MVGIFPPNPQHFTLHISCIFGSSMTKEFYAPHVRPDWDLKLPPDHDSTFNCTETPAPTTCPSVTSKHVLLEVQVTIQRLWG